jgi:polyhydroxyalkanoate synthase
MSPSNFLATNPEVLQTTIETGGENLLRGLTNLLDDLERGRGQLAVTMADLKAFRLGENVAATPGKVILQNELMQLIQYAPLTPLTIEVKRRPLVIVPPCINKFYVLDLRPENSFIKWAVDQGHTVFVISWVNPGSKMKIPSLTESKIALNRSSIPREIWFRFASARRALLMAQTFPSQAAEKAKAPPVSTSRHAL